MESQKKLHYLIPEILAKIIKTNELNNKTHISSIFDQSIKGYDIKEYLKRIIKYSKLEKSTLIYALCLIDMLCLKEILVISKKNIHVILLTACVLAVKMNEDVHYRDIDYAWIGKINTKAMFEAESLFAACLDFKLHVNSELYNLYSNALS